MTAMAFLQFARRRVDVAVVEVGLGGRLDATNVVQPEVAAITSIGFDHCDMLGDRLDLIAAEKAGIIKPGRPVVHRPDARPSRGGHPRDRRGAGRAGVSRCARSSATRSIVIPARIWRATISAGTPRRPRWSPVNCRRAGNWTDEVIARGLLHASWPGRWQRMSVGGRPLILDASHNPEGAQVLDVNLARLVAETGRKPVIMTGALGEYRARALLEVIGRHARRDSSRDSPPGTCLQLRRA